MQKIPLQFEGVARSDGVVVRDTKNSKNTAHLHL
jgi:hypothetical protein